MGSDFYLNPPPSVPTDKDQELFKLRKEVADLLTENLKLHDRIEELEAAEASLVALHEEDVRKLLQAESELRRLNAIINKMADFP